MANKKAARKYVLQSRKHAEANGIVRSKLRTLAKKVRAAVEAGAEDVRSVAAMYMSALDKAAKTNVIHKNSANRRKSICAKLALAK